ncbi:unnamed protein product [Rhizoctonia solani]|nr:unnamed protein product [Rhizoctonia solani]
MEVSRQLEEINNEIQSLTGVLSQIPDDHPTMSLLLTYLATTHDRRFALLHELDDLEKAIEYKTRALPLTPDDDPELSHLLASLAAVHAQRFQRLGDLSDIAKAVEHGHRSVSLTPDGDSGLALRIENLGSFHIIRFESLGELTDVEDAIQYKSRAVSLTADNDPSLPGRLNSLAVSHNVRFQHLGTPEDIEKAINYEARALALAPDGHPHLPDVLQGLGLTHSSRFKRLGDLGDLEHAIEYQSRALALTPDGHPNLQVLLAGIGVSYNDRFERLGELSDLENAMEYQSRALALTPDGHPELPRRLSSLGLSYRGRFKRLGELSDLESAIEHLSRALTLTPDGHPDLSRRLAYLGVFHNERFQRLGELSDLGSAMKYESRAVALTPEGHPDLPNRLMNLGVSYNHRFERLEELSDLENAIKHYSRALALTPDGHPLLPAILTNIGASHRVRSNSLGELSDLDKAIEYELRALALTPDGHPYLSTILSNLAVSHKDRSKRLDELSDLKQALDYESRALALTPDGHPGTSISQSNHATTHLHYYEQTRDHSHLQHSLDSFRSASLSLSGAPRDRFRNAQYWANIASIHSPDNRMEAYQTAIDLLPQFIWLGATTNQRYQDLSTTEALAVNAAFAAIRSSNYSLALEWLEHARCVVWNQALMLRSPLDELHSVDSDLGTRLQAVANQLHNAGSDSRESLALASGSMSPEQVALEHRRLAKEYDDLLVQIRKLPGFNEFLRPMKATSLIQAARTGPVVVINCHKEKCDALIVLPGEQTVGHVPLPNFSAQGAQRARQALEGSLRSKGIRERGVKVRQEPGHDEDMSSLLTTLWHHVIKPILDHLGYMNKASTDSLPHITWCPTGALSFLPLHAAGDYVQPASRVFDHVVSSYTPTLTALLASGPSVLSTRSRVLAVGQANTSGHSALPGATRELAYLQTHMTDSSQYSQLIDGQATVPAVLDAMGQHDWVHLACHAHQNVGDPSRSGFFLQQGTLDLAEISRRSFKGKGLAFLSACQTAMGDERLADEAVHLASGMLMAGYSSVIATMWSVHDEDAPVVADKVYAQLMKDKRIGNGEAGRALHNAVAILREAIGEQKFERWVPYIHIGS